MLSLLDKEDEDGVVKDNFTEFQQMYHPVAKKYFKDIIEFKDDFTFNLDRSDAAKRFLAMHINDNLYKNLSKFSMRFYDSKN